MITTTQLLAGNFDRVGTILQSFLSQWWGPALGVVGAAAGILAVAAAIKYVLAAHSGDEQKLTQAKKFVTGIIIGVVIMFLIAGLLPVIISCFQSWFESVDA